MTGVTRLDIDSATLRLTPSTSMADALAFNPSVFVKTSGRATLSTVSMRGASASHTYVEWNGLPVNSPSLGSTDFSLIPASFIDRASIFYGGSSTAIGAGGLGGAITMLTGLSDIADGFSLSYTQGIASFSTFDQMLSAAWRKSKFSCRTRVSLSTSRNDFSYINHDKKLNIYDDSNNIIGQYHPRERNNGAYTDLHLLQQLQYSLTSADRLTLDAWWTYSRRDIPLTTVDYSEGRRYENRQRDNTLRTVAAWTHTSESTRIKCEVGAIHSRRAYNYGFDNGSGVMNRLTTARTRLNTLQCRAIADWNPFDNISSTASFSVVDNSVASVDHSSLINPDFNRHSRIESTLAASIRWQYLPNSGIALNVRQQLIGNDLAPTIASILADHRLNHIIALRASITRNSKTPSLNDLYFIPGGNPDLRPERSMSYDAGATFTSGNFTASATGYFSRISDMIQWLPNPKGFFSPSNIQHVNSSGLEATASVTLPIRRAMSLILNGAYSFTHAVNRTRPTSAADASFNRQLPYTPRHTASLKARLQWQRWHADWHTNFYSRRTSMSSGSTTPGNTLPTYLVSDITVSRDLTFNHFSLNAKLALNNIFNADYVTVLTHPMPGFNIAFYLTFTL